MDFIVKAVGEHGKQPILFNVPYVRESMFPPHVAAAAHADRDCHNGRLAEYCRSEMVPLADICSVLADDHFGDPVHPNEQGARQIAETVFEVLSAAMAAER